MIRIVVPMGGEGRRFAETGHSFPKPLVEIRGKPMIEIVAQNLTPAEPHRFVFVCRQDHIQKFSLADVLRLVAPECHIVPLRNPTAGALCSVLLAMDQLDNDDELLIANADQFIAGGVDDFLRSVRARSADGAVMTFPSTHPKWSFVKVEEERVVSVAEKRPISRDATAGLYYFRHGNDFVAAAQRMLMKNATVGGEFYVAPVFNELILKGKMVVPYRISREAMFGLGTPEDVALFVESLGKDAVA